MSNGRGASNSSNQLVVALVVINVASIIGIGVLAFNPIASTSIPTLVGLALTTITALIALINSGQAKNSAAKVDEKLNGTLPGLVQQEVQNALPDALVSHSASGANVKEPNNET